MPRTVGMLQGSTWLLHAWMRWITTDRDFAQIGAEPALQVSNRKQLSRCNQWDDDGESQRQG